MKAGGRPKTLSYIPRVPGPLADPTCGEAFPYNSFFISEMAASLSEKAPNFSGGTPDTNSDTGSPADIDEKNHTSHVEALASKAERGHSGLRIDGDDLDHLHEPKMTLKRFMSLLAMALLWTGSQVR